LDKALKYVTLAAEISSGNGFTRGEMVCLDNLGMIYSVRGELDLALALNTSSEPNGTNFELFFRLEAVI